MISDLFVRGPRRHIALFMQCPGAVVSHAKLSGEESFVPDVRVRGDQAMHMLEFVGRLIGIAFRCGVRTYGFRSLAGCGVWA